MVAGANYVGITGGTVTFLKGNPRGTVTVNAIGGSLRLSDGTKTFTVSLSDPANPTVARIPASNPYRLGR